MKAGVVIAGVVAAAAGVGGAWWAFDDADGEQEGVVIEGYTQPETRSIASTILATGIIRLRVGAEVRIGSQMSGIVEELNVVVGSKVKQGDVIARIDARSLRSRLEQANAQVRVLRQEVRRAEVELERARQQIAASAATRRLQEQALEAEQQRFDVGSSTALLVAQVQRDLLAARIAEVEAVVNYRIARVRLYVAEGSLLARRGIRVPGAELLRVP